MKVIDGVVHYDREETIAAFSCAPASKRPEVNTNERHITGWLNAPSLPVYVGAGAWNWPEARFYMQCEKKPRLFHRLMLRWLLGIKWVDGDAPWTKETSP